MICNSLQLTDEYERIKASLGLAIVKSCQALRMGAKARVQRGTIRTENKGNPEWNFLAIIIALWYVKLCVFNDLRSSWRTEKMSL